MREIKEKLFKRFMINVSNKWMWRYLFLFSHHIPNSDRSIKSSLDYLIGSDYNLSLFAYFILGHRANQYQNRKTRADINKNEK
jgi:hypothetical protein